MRISYLLLAAALLFLTGCTRLTKSNYDKIKTGMTYDEVVKIIGKPEHCSEAIGLSSCEWKSGDAVVKINFIADQVTLTTAEGLK